MTAAILNTIRVHLIHLGAMPGEAEIMANYANNTLPEDTCFGDAIDYIKQHFGI